MEISTTSETSVGGHSAAETIILIEGRALVRQCFADSLKSASGYNVLAFLSVDECLQSAEAMKGSLVVICTGEGMKDAEVNRQLSLLAKGAEHLPLVLISDDEDPNQIVKALEAGCRGFIPTSVPLAVAVEAMRFVKAGGTFVPASSILASRHGSEDVAASTPVGNGMFTSRQAAVVDSLLKGKANKIIAYELNMCESTVKVHVRSIMKKLKARNRTEVAYIVNGMKSPDRLSA
jgi:DNA-binding NarL/FixJ family response regulator